MVTERASVVDGPVPAGLEGATARGVLWSARPGALLLRLPGIGRMLVQDGAIRVAREPRVDESAVRAHLDGLPLAAWAAQRGALPLHAAAAVSPDGRGVVLAGDSGAGKSALLATLRLRGYRPSADDVAVVARTAAGAAILWPTGAPTLLWPDVVGQLGLAAHVQAGGPLPMQRLWPIAAPDPAEPAPLAAVVILSAVGGAGVELRPLRAADRFAAVGEITYNTRATAALLATEALFHLTTAVARSAQFAQLRRPRRGWSLTELADRVELFVHSADAVI